jgi:hypothetical protein
VFYKKGISLFASYFSLCELTTDILRIRKMCITNGKFILILTTCFFCLTFILPAEPIIKWTQSPVLQQGQQDIYVGWDETSAVEDSNEYINWVTVGMPDCWNCPYQCHGDADCLAEGKTSYRVYDADLAILMAAWDTQWPDSGYNPCADFNRDLKVDSGDDDIAQTWYGQPGVPGDCRQYSGSNTALDDFFCDSNLPITNIRWWGSFENWSDVNVPSDYLPNEFYITIWTDVPDPNTANPETYSHPGQIIWNYNCTDFDVAFYGWEYDPQLEQTDLAKFVFNTELHPKDYWYQPGDSNTYWLGITAVYNQQPQHVWGWETREHFYSDDAVILHTDPRSGNDPYPATSFEPIEYNDLSWDLSFELLNDIKLPAEAVTDLADAPDSSNNFSTTMSAYPGVSAQFPTVYAPLSPPCGPIHWFPQTVAYLGDTVSLEAQADIGPDNDGVNNIDPNSDTADLDGGDDGVPDMPLNLPHCGLTTFDYEVTIVNPDIDLYVNAWFDWNRDGDWDDNLSQCWTWDNLLIESYPEWAVQNQMLSGLSTGKHTITTPPFNVSHYQTLFNDINSLWMRITLSEQPWNNDFGPAGSGPVNGYLYGETEDYHFTPVLYPKNWEDYNNWVAVGRPDCWLQPRQCRGDADNICEGKCPYCVFSGDLNILLASWGRPYSSIEGQTYNDIPLVCADFNHKLEGKGSYRVFSNDLNILLTNWAWCSGGPPPDCFRE